MTRWWNDANRLGPCATRAFADIDHVFSLDGEVVARDSLSCVLRVELDGVRYYVKRYLGNGKTLASRWFGLRQWLAQPRVAKEWEHLLLFARWGIPTARLVAFGLERRLGGFRRGALVTEEIVGATDLAAIARSGDARLGDANWVAAVVEQLAQFCRALHGERFAHSDLKWRNVLVVGQSAPRVYLIDCPSGGFWRGPFLEYRIVKDLACLDKVAVYHQTRSQRLRFYLSYVGRRKLTAEDKRRVAKITRFFAGRE